MIPQSYPITDADYSCLNEKKITFKNIRTEGQSLTGTGTLRIRRHDQKGIAEIFVEQWFLNYGTTRIIHLGEGPFKQIQERIDGLFLDGATFSAS